MARARGPPDRRREPGVDTHLTGGIVADQHPAIASVDLDVLIDRAQNQYDLLERERLAAGRGALAHIHAPVWPSPAPSGLC
jgi:hypothetical protein